MWAITLSCFYTGPWHYDTVVPKVWDGEPHGGTRFCFRWWADRTEERKSQQEAATPFASFSFNPTDDTKGEKLRMVGTSLHVLISLHYKEKAQRLGGQQHLPRIYKHGFDFNVLIIFIFTLDVREVIRPHQFSLKSNVSLNQSFSTSALLAFWAG